MFIIEPFLIRTDCVYSLHIFLFLMTKKILLSMNTVRINLETGGFVPNYFPRKVMIGRDLQSGESSHFLRLLQIILPPLNLLKHQTLL